MLAGPTHIPSKLIIPEPSNFLVLPEGCRRRLSPSRGRPECQGVYNQRQRELMGKHPSFLSPQMEELWGLSTQAPKDPYGIEPQLTTRIPAHQHTALTPFPSQYHFPMPQFSNKLLALKSLPLDLLLEDLILRCLPPSGDGLPLQKEEGGRDWGYIFIVFITIYLF